MIPYRSWVSYYINPRIRKLLALEVLRHGRNWDTLVIVTGDEGVGKTTLTQQLGHFCTPIDLRDFAWNPKQVLERLDDYEDKNILIDEGIIGSRRDWAKKEVRAMTNKLTKIRKQRNFIWWLVPNFYDLDSRIVRRARGLIYIFLKNPDTRHETRGYARYYNREWLRRIYYEQEGSMNAKLGIIPVRPGVGIPFNFPNHWVVDEDEYNRMAKKFTVSGLDEVNSKGLGGLKDKPVCPSCGSSNIYATKKRGIVCRKCNYPDSIIK